MMTSVNAFLITFKSGQLIGFQRWTCDFQKPQIIKLSNGLFVMRKFGRFMLVIGELKCYTMLIIILILKKSTGSDRNICESIALYRADLISDILNFYYGGIETLFNQLDEKNKFSEVLLSIFETYLPSIQFYGNLSNSSFRFILPKSSSHLFVNACQILENLALRKEMFGGVIVYNSKIVTSQLSHELSKMLIISDPFRIKTYCEDNLSFRIPTAMRIVKGLFYVKNVRRLIYSFNLFLQQFI